MRPLRKFSSLALLSLLSAWSAAAAELRLPTPEIETLPNGLTVAWFVSDSIPVVDMALLVKSGFRDDPAGKAGTAELVSNLLDRGAGGESAQQIARAIEMLGASRYASVDEDSFSIGMHGLAQDAPTLLGLMARMALKPDFPEAEVTREHARLLDRWTHIADYGDTLVALAYRRVLTAGTEYGRGNFLSVPEFKKVGREDVVAFHQKNFTPKNSILMIVGKVDRRAFRESVVSEFGGWQGEVPARKRSPYADRRVSIRKGQILLVDRPALTQAQIRIGGRAPLITSPDHYSLVVANALLGEFFNSRLNALVRDKLGLTYSIGSGFAYSRDFASFTIATATRNETAGPLIRRTIDVLKGLRQGPVPADEVNVAKEYLVGGFPLSTATLGSVASRWLGGYVFDLGPDYLNEFIPKVSAISPAQVIGAVNRHIDPEKLLIVVAGDAKEIEKSLRAARFTDIRRVSARDLE